MEFEVFEEVVSSSQFAAESAPCDGNTCDGTGGGGGPSCGCSSAILTVADTETD